MYRRSRDSEYSHSATAMRHGAESARLIPTSIGGDDCAPFTSNASAEDKSADRRDVLCTAQKARQNGEATHFFVERRPLALLKTFNYGIRRRRKRHSEYGGDGGAFSHNLRTTTILTAIIFSLILGLFLTGFVFLRRSNDSADDDFVVDEEIYERFRRRPKLRFGAAHAEDVELWLVDGIGLAAIRRRRNTATNLRAVGERNLASECGEVCTLRLRHPLAAGGGRRDVAVEFRRWTGGTPPLVQLLDTDANRSTLARPFSAPTACIYTASVNIDVVGGAKPPHSIVNLCGDNGGMFGMLIFADAGTFAIEPLLEANDESDDSRASRRRRTAPTDAVAEARLRTAHLVYRLLPQRFDATVDTIIDGGPTTLSRTLNDPNDRNDFNHASDFSRFTVERFPNDDLNDLSNDFEHTNSLPFSSLPLPHEHQKPHVKAETGRKPRIVILRENTAINGNESVDSDGLRRSRRSANSWDNYIEVLVVADYRMLLYHQRNLENYVLTLFSTVASIYRHPSLGASINIVVVRLIILKHERAGPQVSPRAQQTLQQFCAWQQNYNDPNDDALSHHDVAILLTRHDICRATNKCDTLGLAELGTMCDAHKSCAIIEDNGLSAAFTIAHELGHTLNIPHDDERKCGEFMPLNKNNYHIMAPTLEYNTNPWSWSPCSAHMLSKFLDTHRAQTHCILDQPAERRYFDRMFKNSAPGDIYSVNQQCQFVFGAGAEICPYMPTCRRLWCSVSYGYQMGCRTQHMPWADGTPCGDNMWCHSGHCVGMSPRQRQKQDGSWGEWSPWRECSRSCNGGVQKALRDCDSPPPANGGRYCVGQRERYRSCNVHDCPWDTAGFRESQCAAFDGRDVGIHGVPSDAKWLPKYTGVSENERCQLYCRQVGSAAFYLLRDKVLDGTPCDQSTDDICIDGVCHKAGCDHRLGSERKRDACGICGGNSTTCRTVHGTFNERAAFGYNEVLRLPAGAANIDIRQTAYNNANDDDNYLALRSSNGDFLLNGHYQVSVFRQQVYVLDTVLEYSGSDHATERLNGTGPLRTDVFLHVLSVGQLNPPNIQYTFTVPIEQRQQPPREQQLEEQRRKQQQEQKSYSSSHQKSHNRHRNHHHNPHPQPPPVNNFYWRHADSWSNCTAKCQGSQMRRIVCVESAAHAPGQQRVVEDRMCTSASAPDLQQRVCNIDCFNKWWTTARKIACVRVFTNGGEELAPEDECRAAGLIRPSPTAAPDDNNGESRYPGRWTYSEYSACSASCGTSGVSQRSAHCIDAAGGELDARHCDASIREPIRTDCNRTPCPRWAYGHWSECSRSCGGGVRVRNAVCQDASGSTLPAARCPADECINREKCNDAPCTQWKFGDWSTCTTTCGRGVQRREARCIKLSRGGAHTVIDAARCDSRARIVEKECTLAACAHWLTGTWSACSATCADGFQTRTVACVGAGDARLAERLCATAGERPASHQTCHSGACPQWKIREWSECSVTCGTGVRRRDVTCMFREQAVDDSLCTGSAAVTPIRQEHCALLACTRWDVRPWGGCSATCGTGGVQRRVVRCLRGATVVDDHHCDAATQPRAERACERDPCPMAEYSWEAGVWSECSVSCGGGTQQRVVQCISRDDRRLTDEYCRRLTAARPLTSQTCNLKTCAVQWHVGPWAPNCPQLADCRRPAVVQRRRVFCETVDDGATQSRRLTLPDAHCDIGTRPTESRDCEMSACTVDDRFTTTAAVWDIGNWTTCSASCGGGWRRRTVDCVDGVSKTPRPASLCVADQRPAEFEPCNADSCATVAWHTHEWSTCSVTCGTGIQRRRVWCQSEVLTAPMEVEAALCTRQTNASLPAETRACRAPAECIAWRPGRWSACSQSCGRGVRTRTVKCVALDDDGKDKNEVDVTLCADMPQPASEQKCRDVQCPRWQTSAWTPCSANCGAGVSRRDIFCQRGRHSRVDDSECAYAKKPFKTRACQTTACPTYRWNVVSPWSKCTELCKPSDQHRLVQCVSDANRRAVDAMCEASGDPAPITRRPCPLTACPYHWVAGAWSTCSKTCGSGIQFRKIECHVSTSLIAMNETSTIKKRSIRYDKISSDDNKDVSIVTEAATSPPTPPTSSMVVASRFCLSLKRPAVSASCQLSDCDAPFQWNVGPWSECSSTCGPGFKRRRVRCLSRVNGERVDRKYCESDGINNTISSPRRLESCFLRNCLPIDCADVKSQHNGLTIPSDRDYDVVVNGRRVPVHCYAMNETVPKTYISVDNETNFAEFYSKRLAYPYSCPYEGRRNDSCACNDDGHVNHGRTRFSRLRVDLRNMRINPNDFTFASSDYGNMVAYGSAGDCYSMTECPQGQFSIDLRGTGLKIADDLQWVGQGYRVTTRVERSEGGMRVNGVCGGYCGECAPDRFKGLVLEPSEKSP